MDATGNFTMTRLLWALFLLVGCGSSPTAIPPDQDCSNAVPAGTTRIKLAKGKLDHVSGLRNFTLHFSNQPMRIWMGSDDYIIRHVQKVRFGKRVRIVQACSFIGLVQGDVVEADVNISTDNGASFYLRSKHKENLSDFDAWDCREYSITTDGVRIGVLGRTTNRNEINNNCFSLIHYGVKFLVEETPNDAD